MIILQDNLYQTYNEVILFVISGRTLGSFQLNEVHKHNTAGENNTEMMDQILNHQHQSTLHPNQQRKERIVLYLNNNRGFCYIWTTFKTIG